MEALVPFMDEKIYDDLRTQQQLGYYVGVCQKYTCGIHGISLFVQSSDYSPVELEQRVFNFIDNFYEEFLNKETFERYKQGVILRLK